MGYHSSDLVMRARIYSLRAHWTPNKSPSSLLDHLLETATLVQDVGGSDIEQAGAWLHTVVQDAGIPIGDVMDRFGFAIGQIVDDLTSPKEYKDMPVLKRRLLQAERMKTMSRSVKLVKLACLTSEMTAFCRGYYSDWRAPEQLDLLGGSYMVALSCFGVNQKLEFEFNQAYLEAILFFNRNLPSVVKSGDQNE